MVDNLSRGGVLIKILVWRHFELTPQFMSETNKALCIPTHRARGPHLANLLSRGTFVVIMQILLLVSEGSGLANRIRLLWSAVY